MAEMNLEFAKSEWLTMGVELELQLIDRRTGDLTRGASDLIALVTRRPFPGDVKPEITVVLKNGEGSYVADEATLDRLEGEGRVVVRYVDVNPNGSLRHIAGISNERGNVVGLMPHPEHAVEDLCGPGTDGLGFFTSVLTTLVG